MKVGTIIVLSFIVVGVVMVMTLLQSQTKSINQTEYATNSSIDISKQNGDAVHKTIIRSLEDKIKTRS